MNIKIDTREHNQDMFDAFDLLCANEGWSYEKTFLEVGDITCGNVVIERKEAGDFVHSIMDGRLKEQAAKMNLNYEHKYVIIEGNPYNTESRITTNAIIGKMTSLLVKHNIKILYVQNPAQLAYACFSLINKHIEGNIFDPAEHSTVSYKVDNTDILTAMLYQVPRLGWDKAKLIASKSNYSLKTFVEKATYERLIEIEGIGDVMAKRIMSYITK
jgi:ERCC4-type nuclease